jgi:hypothetical protein
MSEPTKTAEPTTGTTEPAAEPKAQTQGDPADLGDAGKKALDAERTARKAAEKTATDLQAQIDKINQANESAVEKAQREAKEFQEAAQQATADALRFRVAAKHSISEEDADLFLTGTDEATLERQAARLVERTPSTSTAPRPDLTQGGNGGAGATDKASLFAQFLNQTA